jgi:hypothetical protein
MKFWKVIDIKIYNINLYPYFCSYCYDDDDGGNNNNNNNNNKQKDRCRFHNYGLCIMLMGGLFSIRFGPNGSVVFDGKHMYLSLFFNA